VENPLVSIIIPIYNVEQYLERCLESIYNQTYKNIEVLLINDGSPDQSYKIAKAFAEKDLRFKYYEKDNGGLSSARNFGIDRCSGEYISFVDSDDWVEEDFIDRLVEASQRSQSDIAICNMRYIYSDGSVRQNVPQIIEEKTVSNTEALSDLFNSRYFRNHAQNKLYRAKLFKETGIRYPLGKLYEDIFTTYRVFYESERVIYIPLGLYDYLQARPGSILNTKFSNRQFDAFEGIDCIRDFLKKNNIYRNMRNDFQQLAISNVLAMGNHIYPIYNSLTSSEKKIIRNSISGTKKRFDLADYLTSSNIGFAQKTRYYLMTHMLGVYTKIMKVIRR